MLEYGGTERAGTAGDHEGGVRECGHLLFSHYIYKFFIALKANVSGFR